MTKWGRDGSTIYTLMHAGWRKGEERLKNQFAFSVYTDAEVTAEEKERAIAEIHTALNEHDALCAQNAALISLLKQALAVHVKSDCRNAVHPSRKFCEMCGLNSPHYLHIQDCLMEKIEASIAATEGSAERHWPTF